MAADVVGQERLDPIHLVEIAIEAISGKQVEVCYLSVDSAAGPARAGHLRSESSFIPE